MAILQTLRLTLRPCCPDDRADFIRLERDPEVMRFLNGGFAVNREKSGPDAGFLMPRGTEDYVWTARRTGDGAFTGWFCLWPESAVCAELGYRLQREDWGHGLASEGAAALIGWGFGTAGYETIVATTMAVNHGSRRVMEKTGMMHTRTVLPEGPPDFPGCEEGEVWYELTRAEWNSR
ncbi:GNAT family N-acetyltransferase [Pararhizobium sp.]|uniref:GNAT family N-acetyltransferase n=1 Tax=Pararhizobium sp. TaxID=1977563 RepID=UPI002724FD20|nr:GNAT family N-acetyltransferase [Pararhizobium sp.]MDO9417256.1 GNAT family N-acetyltransferase [Pararhizobium sp.]